MNVSDLTLDQLARLIVNKMPSPTRGGSRVDIFTQLEGAIVRAALERTRGNKQAAANLLGLYRPRLYSMLRKHNLHDTIRESEQNATENDAVECDLAESEAPDPEPNQDLLEHSLDASETTGQESSEEAPKEAPKESPGGDAVSTNISGPDASEFHFRKGMPFQY